MKTIILMFMLVSNVVFAQECKVATGKCTEIVSCKNGACKEYSHETHVVVRKATKCELEIAKLKKQIKDDREAYDKSFDEQAKLIEAQNFSQGALMGEVEKLKKEYRDLAEENQKLSEYSQYIYNKYGSLHEKYVVVATQPPKVKEVIKKVNNKNRIDLLGGYGPTGVNTEIGSSYVSTELIKGAVGGISYTRDIGDSVYLGGQVQSNKTFLLDVGFGF